MITAPDTLTDMRRAIAEGREVDYDRLLRLQALDLAQAGEQFTREAFTRQKEADERLKTG